MDPVQMQRIRSSLMLYPTPELPDGTLISRVDLPTRVLNALTAAGLRTVGEVRQASDAMLLSLPDLGAGPVGQLRTSLGVRRDSVTPFGKKHI
jgi:hypothetical protein